MGDEGQALDKPAGSTPSGGVDKIEVHSVINRRSRWLSSIAALKYVSSISKDDDIKVRDSDRATAIALLICCVAALSCLLVPQLEAHRVDFVLAADVLVGLALLMYVATASASLLHSLHARPC